MARLRAEIERAGEITPELKAELARAEYAIRMSRYYQDAVELARRVTEWSKSLTGNRHFIVCSGGSGGMMEAANRGASMAGGKTVGLHIDLTTEEIVNPYVTPDLVFRFHYFFMRKFWFVYLASAGDLPGRIRDNGRAFRGIDADSDQETAQGHADCSVRRGVLE